MGHARHVGIAVHFALFLTLSTARAAFTYQTCSTDSRNPTTLPVDSGTSLIERAADNWSNYSNHIFNYWPLYFNPNVVSLVPSLNNVVTEAGHDILSIQSYYDVASYSGTWNDGFQTQFFLGDSTTDMPNQLGMYWSTNETINLPSMPKVDRFQLTCSTSSAPLVSWPISNNVPIQGVLLGTGDVHYFSIHHVAGERLAISLEVLSSTTSDPDLDLYVSLSNQFPDDSSFDYRDYSGNGLGALAGAGGFITIPSRGTGTYYIGVHSFRGDAHYVLHASGYSTTNKSPYVICVEGALDPTASYWPNYVTTLSTISAYVAQYTQGGVWPLNWAHKVLPTGTCGSDEYCRSASGCDFVAYGCGFQSKGSRTHMSNPASTRCTDYQDPTYYGLILAHEFGHSQLGFGDEYQKNNPNGQGAFCGHTIMNGPSNSHVLCTPYTHCTDPALDSTGAPFFGSSSQCAAGSDDWTLLRASGKVSYVPDFGNMTPDEWDTLRTNASFLSAVSVTP